VGATCAVVGNINTDNSDDSGLFYSGSIDAISCHVQCLQDPNCKSFLTIDGDNFCMKFMDTAAQAVIPNPNSGYVFYDVGCPQYRPVSWHDFLVNPELLLYHASSCTDPGIDLLKYI
jgi:hypothetical protein